MVIAGALTGLCIMVQKYEEQTYWTCAARKAGMTTRFKYLVFICANVEPFCG
jgi:hypothetical protein